VWGMSEDDRDNAGFRQLTGASMRQYLKQGASLFNQTYRDNVCRESAGVVKQYRLSSSSACEVGSGCTTAS
jgi:hypothetical protein